MKKKPNYKLRRTVAKITIGLIVVLIIVAINFKKITRIPIYMEYRDYKNFVSAFYDINYTNEETRSIMKKIIDKEVIGEINENYIAGLKEKGYSKKAINFIILNFNKLEIKKFLNKKYNKDLEKYISLDLFNFKNYQRYLDYQEDHPKLSLEDVVIRVELDLDKSQYESPVEEKDPNSLTALVNKHRYISSEYEPDDLVDMEDEYSNNMFGVKVIRKETYEQFKKMVEAAKKDDIYFKAESAYRDYDYQESLYRDYVNEYGKSYADDYAARAGHSEHQLGTTLDIANVWTIEEGDDEYNWIDKNGYKYGFIFRYKTKFEDITGYKAEGWHIRYVGVDAATTIHKKGISFDEYWIKYVKNNLKK